ncbi:hypothetical protein [Roseiconus lacunae]|uniref:Uncharacterized protein n=1 Tax=Roseiconus lacunae TaxID=2605694 RepID=A0ABT7PLS9_9BACT|nr:hypothetical protein [Roseiconus lacunae]MDM4017458.1 hypothetical protein [Roseiconus lacunae]
MNHPTAANAPDDFELTVETLDAWELELDQFATQITRRLNDLAEQCGPQTTTEATDAFDTLQALHNHSGQR